jgi:hypothetical protein
LLSVTIDECLLRNAQSKKKSRVNNPVVLVYEKDVSSSASSWKQRECFQEDEEKVVEEESVETDSVVSGCLPACSADKCKRKSCREAGNKDAGSAAG